MAWPKPDQMELHNPLGLMWQVAELMSTPFRLRIVLHAGQSLIDLVLQSRLPEAHSNLLRRSKV
jgi:hypothetical protein